MFDTFAPNLLVICLEFLCFYILTCGFFALPLFHNKRNLFLGMIPAIISTLLETYCHTKVISLIVGSFVFIIYFYVTFKKSFLHTLFLYLLEYSCIVICELLLLPLFGLSGESVHSLLPQFCGLALLVLLSMMAYSFLPMSSLLELLSYKNNTLIFICINTFLIVAGIVLFIKLQPSDFFAGYFLTLLFMLALIFLNGEVYINHQKQVARQKQLDAYETYLPIIENLLEQVREKQHDYHNHLQTLHALGYTCKNYDELRTQLLDTTENYILKASVSPLLKLNLHLLSGFLISKVQQAEHTGKTLNIHIEQYHIHTTCSEYELIEHIGILIDNALEATPHNGIIYAYLSSEKNKLIFQIQNPGPLLTPELCKQIFCKNYTSKGTSSHGIGLYKLHKYIISHNGTIHLQNLECNHQTYIMFRLVL